MNTYTYLALGDSYTIGEQVRINDCFPYQTIYNLRKNDLHFASPEIIATTGFTTDELNEAIYKTATLKQYDFVSLLIGVNNQYRGRSVANFEEEFEALLKRAIGFAGDNAAHVLVLSIPDWGVTPFAADRDKNKIAVEIDAYNNVCKTIALKHHCHYIDITQAQRIDGSKEDFLAADKLHPSANEYEKWAVKLSEKISTMI